MGYEIDTSWLGKPHHTEPHRLYSQTGADWQYRVDFDRLRNGPVDGSVFAAGLLAGGPLDVVTADLLDQGASGHTEELGGAGLVPVVCA